MAKEEQYMKPIGEEGIKVLDEMNEHHKELSAWGLSFVPQAFTPSRILDVGCGGGNALRAMSMKWPRSVLSGVDISEESVKVTLTKNRIMHRIGRIDACVASVSDLPFEDGEFDLVTAIETYFFWPDLRNDLKKVASKIHEGGYLLIISEQYFDGKNDEDLSKTCEQYHMRLTKDNDEMLGFLEDAGFSAKAETDEDRNWVAFIAKKR